MLVVFYIISAISSVFAYMSIFLRKKANFGHWFIAMVITIICGLAFYIPMISKIIETFPNVNFGSVFAVATLFVWQSAFIFNDADKLVCYEIIALLFTFIIFLICPTFDTTSYRIPCYEEHISVDVVYVWDDNFCDDFVTKTIHLGSKPATYSFYVVSDEGHPIEKTIPANLTAIHPITSDETSPYLEIIVDQNCSGYNTKTQEHYLTIGNTHYNLYVPEDCITVILEKQNN